VTDQRKTVLVVDDEAVILVLVRSILEREGYAVVTAESAHEALKFIRSCDNDLDLLLTDVQMPDMNGLELARRAVEYRSHVAVAFMTGFSDLLTPDGIPMFRKPFRLDAFVSGIGEMLGSVSLGYRV
jgi:CheY-like chemotaxis protein